MAAPRQRGSTDSLTVADSPSAEQRRLEHLGDASSMATLTSTRALHAEEAARTRAFAAVLGALIAVAMVFIPFQPVPLWLTGAMVVALLGVAGLCAWVFVRSRNPQTYNRRVFHTFALGCASVALLIVYYGGTYSASSVVVVLGLGFFALGDDRRFVTGLAIAVIGGFVVLACLVAFEIIPENGLVQPADLAPPAKTFSIAVTTSVFSVTVWHARLARRATRNAIEQLSIALAEVKQREALVNEANQQLDLALNLDAGERGRHSGASAGGYALGALIGRGAMGEVYSATLEDGGEPIAVKVLADRVIERSVSVDRFRREARISSQLDCDNVVRVLDVGELSDGYPYIAMELLEGHDLSWHLRKKRRMSPAEVVDLVYQISRGLDAAHAAGVVHRDIKPNNLFYDTRCSPSRWKILDFGVARDVDSEGTLTQGAVVGTPGYMAPEQAEGKTPDRRADVFALAAVAYRALTGQPAFAGKNAPETMYRVVHHQPTRPSAVVVLSRVRARAIDAVFAVGLAKDPERRFAGAGDFAAAFEAATRGEIGRSLRERAAAILDDQPWPGDMDTTIS